MKPFEITDSAKAQIERLLDKNTGKYAVSLAVLGGGCAGFKYDWGLLTPKKMWAVVITLKTGTQVDSLWTKLP